MPSLQKDNTLRRIFNGVAALAIAVLGVLPWTLTARNADAQSEGEHIKPTLVKTFRVPGRLDSLTFDSKGEKLVTVGWSEKGDWPGGTCHGDLRIWDVARGTEIAHFGEDAGGLLDVAISPDDKMIVTAGRVLNTRDKGEVRIWDANSQMPIRTLEGHTHWVVSIAYSPDGKLIASGSFDRTVRIWDPVTGKELSALNHSKKLPRSLRFSADGKTLVAGYETESVVLWDVDTWTKRSVFDAKGVLLFSADLSSDGKRLVAGGPELNVTPGNGQGGLFYVWDVSSGSEEHIIRLQDMLSGVAFSPSGKYFATAASPLSSIWSSDTGDEIGNFPRMGTSSDKVQFSPDGKWLAIGGVNDATLWDVSGLGAKKAGR